MRRNHWIVLLGLVIVAAVGVTWFGLGPVRRQAAAPAPTAAAPPKAPLKAQAKPPAPVLPSFDAVHIGPDGKAVLAGRAAPGADVTVLDHGQAIGHVTANDNGEWVLLPSVPLPPGPQQLSLTARKPGAGAPVASNRSLAVLVPERRPNAAAVPPVAVLLPESGSEVPRAIAGEGARTAGQVALDIVEYDADGRTLLSGRADAGAHIAIAVNGRAIGAATTDGDGNWTASLGSGVPVGRYRLALAARAPDGSDAGTLTLELRRAAPGEFGTASYFAVVPGNTLWHLAQHSYGDGVRYVVLYRANRARIRNPDLIYPNELLALPAKP